MQHFFVILLPIGGGRLRRQSARRLIFEGECGIMRGRRACVTRLCSLLWRRNYVMKDELTAVDIQKMKEEIEYRQSVLTPKFKDEVARTRALGDLSENDEYRSAKRELNRNYSRIRYLKAMIETAVVIEVEDTDDDTVSLFDHVNIWYEDDEEERTITIVTTLRNDALSGLISKESPLGKALLGRRVGERVPVRVNDTYSYYVEIRALEKGSDDASLSIN